jgi:hypothetical protein
MKDQKFKEIVNLESIIALKEKSPGSILINDPMVKAQWLLDKLICQTLAINELEQLTDNYYKDRKKWIEEGLDCELLNLGDSQWKKGKVRVKMSVEFIPDEPESSDYQSPLDEIRQEMQQNIES